MKLFVFGYGFSASRFVGGLPRDAVVGVTVRSQDKAMDVAASGVTPYVFDGETPGEGIESALGRATHVLVSVPPGHKSPGPARVGGAGAPEGDPVLKWHGNAIGHGSPALEWIGYLSTVGVYGDHDGGWVDETSPLRPVSARSKARVAAEEAWAATAALRGVPLATLRLSGIYGPGRNGFLALRNGTAKRLVKPGQVFNRIHVDDIAGALALLAERRIGGVFNVTDDEPAPPQDVVAFAASLAGIEPPPETPFDEAELSPMARSFYGENKRVSNARLKEAGYTFRYPSYRTALPELVDEF